MRAVLLALAAWAACQRHDVPTGAGSGSGVSADDCAIVVTRVLQATQTQRDSVGSDAKALIAQMLPVMRDACIEDRWPANLVRCIVDAKSGDLDALQKCNAMMSKDIQTKLQQRMMQTRKP